MSFKIFVATFWAIFLAELADKTQLVGMSMSAKTGKPVTVWLGSVSAYIIITALSVLIGSALSSGCIYSYCRMPFLHDVSYYGKDRFC